MACILVLKRHGGRWRLGQNNPYTGFLGGRAAVCPPQWGTISHCNSARKYLFLNLMLLRLNNLFTRSHKSGQWSNSQLGLCNPSQGQCHATDSLVKIHYNLQLKLQVTKALVKMACQLQLLKRYEILVSALSTALSSFCKLQERSLHLLCQFKTSKTTSIY